MTTAAILGGGVIGGGWAARFLLNGWDVRVFDPDPEAERKIGEVLDNARRSLPGLMDIALPPEGCLSFHDTAADAVTGAVWVQESVPEVLSVKHSVYSELEGVIETNAVLASSTSGFKPSELAQGTTLAEQIMVCHPFNPVYLLPLIEVVPHEGTNRSLLSQAMEILSSVGLHPLHVRKEIDAHIADRFLEAVWREALWLIKDGIATTEEIDDAIRFGFGLRWAQMGLFETYRIAGGEAGMKHFIAQFGPALAWPWTKLMDVPELTDDLVNAIADQSDAQSGTHSIRDLERIRDNNLVGILRALKKENYGAGALLNAHEATVEQGPLDPTGPLLTARRVVPLDWTDYNGHMNEARYMQAFSEAGDVLLEYVGAGDAYVKAGHSFFTLDNHIRYFNELNPGDLFTVETRLLYGKGKKLILFSEMKNAKGELVSTAETFLLHVNMISRGTCDMLPDVAAKTAALMAHHGKLERPEQAGAAIRTPEV